MSETAHITRRISQAEADQICARHDRLWSSKPGGARAVFAWTDLSGVDLTGRNLCDADFSRALQLAAGEHGAREIGVAEIASGEVDARQVGPGENGAGAAGLGAPQPVMARADLVGLGLGDPADDVAGFGHGFRSGCLCGAERGEQDGYPTLGAQD